MPRRNHRPRNRRKTLPPWLHESPARRLSTEQMAQSLVRRGLATPQILDRPKRNHTQEEVNR